MTDTQRNDTMPPDIEAYHMGIHAKKMLVIPINGATRTHCGFCKYRDGVHGVCLLFGRNLGRLGARLRRYQLAPVGLRRPVEGGVRPMNACCYSARQMARNECASALFRVLRPTKEPPQQGTYVFNTALAEIIEEINALRKDREALNRVRSAVEVKS